MDLFTELTGNKEIVSPLVCPFTFQNRPKIRRSSKKTSKMNVKQHNNLNVTITNSVSIPKLRKLHTSLGFRRSTVSGSEVPVRKKKSQFSNTFNIKEKAFSYGEGSNLAEIPKRVTILRKNGKMKKRRSHSSYVNKRRNTYNIKLSSKINSKKRENSFYRKLKSHRRSTMSAGDRIRKSLCGITKIKRNRKKRKEGIGSISYAYSNRRLIRNVEEKKNDQNFLVRVSKTSYGSRKKKRAQVFIEEYKLLKQINELNALKIEKEYKINQFITIAKNVFNIIVDYDPMFDKILKKVVNFLEDR